MPAQTKKANTIFGMTTRELQEFLAKIAKKIPFLKKPTEALEGARGRIEGETTRPEEE